MDKILFLCTGNSARSQMAAALMNKHGKGNYIAYSAGSHPNQVCNPYAMRILEDNGFDTKDLHPKSMEAYFGEAIDFVITLCDSMKEDCPVFPNQPLYAHWGMPDPAAVEGTEVEKEAYFHKTFREISNRVTLLTCIDMTKKTRPEIETELKEIGQTWKYIDQPE